MQDSSANSPISKNYNAEDVQKWLENEFSHNQFENAAGTADSDKEDNSEAVNSEDEMYSASKRKMEKAICEIYSQKCKLEKLARELKQNLPANCSAVADSDLDEVRYETQELYLYHLMVQVSELGLDDFPLFRTVKPSPPCSKNASSLKALTKKFASSPQREWVREQAENVDLNSLNFKSFQDLLSGLFQEGGVTWERVLVLFCFCSDLTIRVFQSKAYALCRKVLDWVAIYMTSKLALWVHNEGGWGKVLSTSFPKMALTISMLGICFVGVLALSFILKRKFGF